MDQRRLLSTMPWLIVAAGWLCAAARALSVPSCQLVAAPLQETLTNVRTTSFNVSSSPFGLVYALHQDVAFVTLNTTLGVLDTTTFTPSLRHEIPLPAEYLVPDGALGLSLTHDGRYLLVALGVGALVVDAAKAAEGDAAAVVGALSGPAGHIYAIEVTITSDGRYAFVNQEYAAVETDSLQGCIEVFELHKPCANGSISSTYIGNLTLGEAVAGATLSPNGSLLYATSEIIVDSGTRQGSLSIIDVEKMKTNPSTALLSNVTAGCSPVRAIVSSDGKTVWVTARQSNHLLAFDAEKLISNPADALLASVQVGTLPVGLVFARNETRIITADSDRLDYANATSGLSVVDVEAALRGEKAVLGRIPTGLFPREFAISPDNGTILVSDYASNAVQAIDVSTLP